MFTNLQLNMSKLREPVYLFLGNDVGIVEVGKANCGAEAEDSISACPVA